MIKNHFRESDCGVQMTRKQVLQLLYDEIEPWLTERYGLSSPQFTPVLMEQIKQLVDEVLISTPETAGWEPVFSVDQDKFALEMTLRRVSYERSR